MLKYFLFFGLFALNTPVQAYNACAGIFVLRSEPLITKSVSLSELHPKFSLTIHRWNRLLGDLRVDKLFLELSSDPVTKSSFNPFSRKIHVGTRLSGRVDSAREKIMAHEFGHAIFNEHFSFFWKKEVLRLKSLLEEAHNYFVRTNLDPRIAAIIRQGQSMTHHVDLAAVGGTWNFIKNFFRSSDVPITELERNINPLEKYFYVKDIVIAYEELFADTIPALLWSDPRAVTDSIENPSEPYFSNQYQESMQLYRKENTTAPDPRDFTVMRFKNWRHEKADKYTLLDPSRGVLWRLYMENLPKNEIPLFLSTFMDATSAHITLRLERREDLRVSAQASDPTQINQEFVQIFVEMAKKNGLMIRKTR